MTQMPSAGDGTMNAPEDGREDGATDGMEGGAVRNFQHGSADRPEHMAADRPSHEELLRHLGAAVLLCWNELSFSSQVKILAQTNDVIGTRPIPEARNEIVKLLLRHTKM